MRQHHLILAAFLILFVPHIVRAQDTDEAGRNPVIWADVPDPDVIRIGDAYYMTSTTMHMAPGVPIMKSTNLVDWEIVGYAYETMANADALSMRPGQNAYGRGSWASSIRYHNGTFFIHTFSYTTGESYIFSSQDVENGPWHKESLGAVFHDGGLFFDDDGRVYLVYGVGDLRIIELTVDAERIKPGGVDRVLIQDAGAVASPNLGLRGEGSHVHKVDGYYYVFLIAWPRGGMRTEIVHRARSLDGPWEGRVVLQDEGIAQGGIVDTPDGKWYAFLFGDRGAVGRIPYLVPMRWEDGWPVMGVDGKAPETLDIPSSRLNAAGIVASDEFDANENALGLAWQWNHNPDDRLWSLTDRPGYLRLTNGRRDESFVATRNTLTQRTFGPESWAKTSVDVNGLNDGDLAGLGILQQFYGYVAVKKEGENRFLTMAAFRDGQEQEVARVPLPGDVVHLKIDADFRDRIDKAVFSYSLDGESWTPIGDTLQMRYELVHFMGARFALFSYATERPRGFADFDYFRIGQE